MASRFPSNEGKKRDSNEVSCRTSNLTGNEDSTPNQIVGSSNSINHSNQFNRSTIPNHQQLSRTSYYRTASGTFQHSSATQSPTITVDELIQQQPSLRIRLHNRAQQYAHNPRAANNFRQLLDFIFRQSNNNPEFTLFNQQSNRNYRTVEENVAILQRIFERFKNTVNQYEAEVLRNFDQLTNVQQEQVVAQYEEATAFIGDLFDWLDKVFDYAIMRVRNGYTIERDGVRILFGRVRDELNILFK